MTRGRLWTSSKGAAELPLGAGHAATPHAGSAMRNRVPVGRATDAPAIQRVHTMGAPPPPAPSPPHRGTLVSHAAAGSEQSGLQVEHGPTGPGQDRARARPSVPAVARHSGQHRLHRPGHVVGALRQGLRQIQYRSDIINGPLRQLDSSRRHHDQKLGSSRYVRSFVSETVCSASFVLHIVFPRVTSLLWEK